MTEFTETVGRVEFEHLQREAFAAGVPLSTCMAPQHVVCKWKSWHKSARRRPKGHRPMRRRAE